MNKFKKTLLAVLLTDLCVSGEASAVIQRGDKANDNHSRFNGFVAFTPKWTDDDITLYNDYATKSNTPTDLAIDAAAYDGIDALVTATTTNTGAPFHQYAQNLKGAVDQRTTTAQAAAQAAAAQAVAHPTQEQIDKAQNDALTNHTTNIKDLWVQSDKNLKNIDAIAPKVEHNITAISDEEIRAKGIEQSQKALIDTNKASTQTNTTNITANTTSITQAQNDATTASDHAKANQALIQKVNTDQTEATKTLAESVLDYWQGQSEAYDRQQTQINKLLNDTQKTGRHIDDLQKAAAKPVTATVAVTPVTGVTVTHPPVSTSTTAPSWLLKLSTPGNLQVKSAAPAVNQAQIDADQDTKIADSAQKVADVTTTANTAHADIVKLQTDVNAATINADDAKLDAATAPPTAQGADTKASQVQTDTATALPTATQASTDATQAKADAATALTTASGVDAKATQAQTDAGQAKQDAAAAKTEATQAHSDAANTLTTANGADLKAQKAGAAAAQATANSNKAAITTNTKGIADNGQEIKKLASTQQNYTAHIDHVQQGVDQNHADILSETHARYQGDIDTLNKANAYTDSKFANIDKRISDVKKQTNAGSASALAAVGIPGLNNGQTWNIGAGVGEFGNAQAVAVGGNYRVTENVALKTGGTASPTTQDFGVFAGVSIGN